MGFEGWVKVTNVECVKAVKVLTKIGVQDVCGADHSSVCSTKYLVWPLDFC